MKRRSWIGVLLACALLTVTTAGAAEFDPAQIAQGLQLHGFLSQGFLYSAENNVYAKTTDGTFQFNEFGLNTSAELTDRLHAGIQLFSRDLGDFSNNTILLDWAYGDFHWNDKYAFRIGKIKIPLGFYNDSRDLDTARTPIFLPQSVYNESLRDSFQAVYGGEIYGIVPLKFVGQVAYQFQLGESDIPLEGSLAEYLEAQHDFEILNISSGGHYASSLRWYPPIEGLRLGASLMRFKIESDFQRPATSESDETDQADEILPFTFDHVTIAVSSLEYMRGDWLFAAEFTTIAGDEETPEASSAMQEEGYFLSAAYQATDRLQLGVYYAEFFPDVNDQEGQIPQSKGLPAHTNWQKEWVGTMCFEVNDFWNIKLEGHLINGTALMLAQHNPDGLHENSWLLALKTTFNF